MVRPSDIVALYIDVADGTLYADEGLSDLTPVGFVISSGIVIDGALVHGSLAELGADDHTQYVLVAGTRAFTDNISMLAVAPTDPSHLVRRDYVDGAVISGTAGVAYLNGLQGAITISGAGEVTTYTVGQVITVSGTPHTAGGTEYIPKALVGDDGVTVISGSNIDTVQGFRAEFVNASGSLQTQIDDNATDIVTTSGHLQTQIDSFSAGEAEPAIVGAGGNVVISGSNITTVSGFRVEFVSASGSLQSQIDTIEASKVDSVNTLTGDITIDGVGEVFVTTAGQTITVSGTPHTGGPAGDEIIALSGTFSESLTISGAPVATGTSGQGIGIVISGAPNALVGTDGNTVISGTSFDTIQGFRSEMVSVSGSLQDQLDATVSGLNDVFAVRVDQVDAITTYIGEAYPGTTESTTSWRIKKMDEVSPDLSITWAEGTANFAYAWTNRASLSYS